VRIWFDTEFIEDGRTIDLLSIGMVRDDGAKLYLEADWTDHSRANEWVKANVLPHLGHDPDVLVNRADMRGNIVAFAGNKPEFWAYYGAYDWVALCQLFGRMVDLPAGWPMYCLDLKQLVNGLGNPKLPAKSGTEHHALADAVWARDAHDWLANYHVVLEAMR
jgi:hypothetical protein